MSPLYEYECTGNGGHVFTERRSIADRDNPVECPTHGIPAFRVQVTRISLGGRTGDVPTRKVFQGREGLGTSAASRSPGQGDTRRIIERVVDKAKNITLGRSRGT